MKSKLWQAYWDGWDHKFDYEPNYETSEENAMFFTGRNVREQVEIEIKEKLREY